jgi:Uma2 family endonuclease
MNEKNFEKEKGKDITYEVDLKTSMICEPVSVYKVDRIYTYEDYLNWPEDERIELIDGKIYHMSAPTKRHQELLIRLSSRFHNYLHGRSCEVYFAPFDVRIDLDLGKDSVVQPDLVVICDDEKLDEKGLNGAPDLLIEVLSKSTAGKDRGIKYNKYLAVGVKEYWIVDPVREVVMVNTLNDGKYDVRTYIKGDVIKPSVLDDLYVNVADLFEGRKGREIVEIETVRKEAQQKGEAEKIEIAKKLLKMEISMEQISEITGFNLKMIQSVVKTG